jgi:hypothetical protein
MISKSQSISTDTDHRERYTKGQGKGKAKGTAEKDGADEMVFDQDTAEEEEKVTRGALISLNIIDLKTPPLPAKFGGWNKRPINAKAQRKLRDSFKAQGIRSFELDNALLVILPCEHLHLMAVHNTLGDPEQAPMLKLTEEGMKAEFLTFAGGHHRTDLIMQQWEVTKKLLPTLEAKLDKKKMLQTKLDKNSSAPVNDLHRAIDELEQKIVTLNRSTYWAVKIYDASK